jgi:hypothetical protein
LNVNQLPLDWTLTRERSGVRAPHVPTISFNHLPSLTSSHESPNGSIKVRGSS